MDKVLASDLLQAMKGLQEHSVILEWEESLQFIQVCDPTVCAQFLCEDTKQI